MKNFQLLIISPGDMLRFKKNTNKGKIENTKNILNKAIQKLLN